MRLVRVILVVLALAWANNGFAQITFNDADGACAASAASVLYAASMSAGSNRVMVIGIGLQLSPLGVHGVSSVTLGGSSTGMIEIPSSQVDAGTDLRNEVYYLVAPSGSANIEVTASGVMNAICAGDVVLDGVDQSTVHRTVDTDSGTSGTSFGLSITSSASDMIVDSTTCWFESCADQEGAGQTLRVNPTAAGNTTTNMSTKPAVGDPTTTSWSVGSGDYWATSGAAFIPAAGATGPGKGTLTQVGVGR